MSNKETNISEARPSLIEALFFIFNQWKLCFKRKDVFRRSLGLSIASLLCLGRKTIASMAIYLKRSSKVPIADYKFFSKRVWQANDLFHPILTESVKYIPGTYITVGVDDTRLSKTGKKIPYTGWGRDPMSPPFQTNLIWGLRELHFSIMLPLYGSRPLTLNDSDTQEISPTEKPTPPRAIPIRWINAPSVKRPGKKASKEQIKEYKTIIKTHNLSTLTVKTTLVLRKELDELGLHDKVLIRAGDASFCNRICLGIDVERTISVSRCRRDAKLCFQAPAGSRRFYDQTTFTPEDVRKDESIPWKTGFFFFGGAWRELKYKERGNVLWRNGTKRKLLKAIILAPTPYWKGSKKNYRDPAYLLATDNNVSAEILIQAYLDRWQMEYCHRDAKSVIGVGQAQVRNQNSVVRQPAFHITTYSALILANIMTYRDCPHPDFGKRPKWRKEPRRITIRALVGMLRGDLEDDPECLKEYGIVVEKAGVAMRQAF